MSKSKSSFVGEAQQEQEFTVALDIGTSKVCALVASPDADPERINVLGMGITESDGLKRGAIVNIDKTVNSIEKVIRQAEQQSGVNINEVVVGIAGDHIKSEIAHARIGISNQDRIVSRDDVARLLQESKNIHLPTEREILHTIPQEYSIDGQNGITSPEGMCGNMMEADVQVITGQKSYIQNISRSIQRLGIDVKSLVLQPLASSRAVLTEPEKEVGVALVDIGGGTTDIAVFDENILRHTSIIAIGGRSITDDIRRVLGIINSEAEKLKREVGHAHSDSLLDDETLMIAGINGRKPFEITRSYLCRIIQSRLEETFKFALDEIRKSNCSHQLGAGVVLTGGSSLISGAVELAEETFGMQVKLGSPSGINYSGLIPEIQNPIYSTAVGLLLYDMMDSKDNCVNSEIKGEKKVTKSKKPRIFNKVIKILRDI